MNNNKQQPSNKTWWQQRNKGQLLTMQIKKSMMKFRMQGVKIFLIIPYFVKEKYLFSLLRHILCHIYYQIKLSDLKYFVSFVSSFNLGVKMMVLVNWLNRSQSISGSLMMIFVLWFPQMLQNSHLQILSFLFVFLHLHYL